MKMKTSLLLTFFMMQYVVSWAQWNTDLSQNITVDALGSDPKVFHASDGYYMLWSKYVGAGMYFVQRYNHDGTEAWSSPMPTHNRALGSSTFTSYALTDADGNLITLTTTTSLSFVTGYCINKISPVGTQLWNGAAGLYVSDFVTGVYLAPATQNLYVAFGDSIRKYDANGNVLWTSLMGPTPTTTSVSLFHENMDGSVTSIYTVFSFGLAQVYVSKFNSAGTRTTAGVQSVTTSLVRFNDPTFLTADAAENLYYVYSSVDSNKVYVQKLTGDTPQLPGFGYLIDTDVYPSIFTSALNDNGVLEVVYNYSASTLSDIYGVKHQTIPLSTLTRTYPTGNVIFDFATGNHQSHTKSLIKMDSLLGFLDLNNVNSLISLQTLDNGLVSTNHPICTTTTTKSRAASSTYDYIGNSKKQVVVAFGDDRDGDFTAELYAQNLTLPFISDIQDLENDFTISVFPNPFSNSITVKSDKKIESIEVYDLSGQKMLSVSNSNEVNTSSLASGVYFVQINGNNFQPSAGSKIIKK